jgi:hypothetical protein
VYHPEESEHDTQDPASEDEVGRQAQAWLQRDAHETADASTGGDCQAGEPRGHDNVDRWMEADHRFSLAAPDAPSNFQTG